MEKKTAERKKQRRKDKEVTEDVTMESDSNESDKDCEEEVWILFMINKLSSSVNDLLLFTKLWFLIIFLRLQHISTMIYVIYLALK